jgi:hypothetical protein
MDITNVQLIANKNKNKKATISAVGDIAAILKQTYYPLGRINRSIPEMSGPT